MTYRQEKMMEKALLCLVFVAFILPAFAAASYAVWYTLLHTMLELI